MAITLAPEPDDDGADADPFGPDSALAALAGFCERRLLPLPPLPEAFIGLLRQVDESVFTSRADLTTLTDFDALIAEAVADGAPPFVALGHEGYGANSWYLRYCVALPGAALFAAVPFGGVYMDADADRAEIGTLFAQAATFIERALAYRGATRFVVLHRGLGRGQWCEGGGPWQDDPNAVATVADRLAG